ncbi:hypothetical protein LEP1GSC008_4136 [Leptospira kirschneri serovar Bulgarica str. Nikolaevo]|uniref:Uncharacterized protein n=1 Tax=Leptospira kirschneri serovar Bulgarica str. Nikolaevo TaxID=1240687 RepID=M6F8Y2_9LEPT|nr:hypothetical protein LEP1GSC008_4136 [Leptospira kirschneri serovar Bulgarica str. Nikolaevo]
MKKYLAFGTLFCLFTKFTRTSFRAKVYVKLLFLESSKNK